jgi:hypothetical protein
MVAVDLYATADATTARSYRCYISMEGTVATAGGGHYNFANDQGAPASARWTSVGVTPPLVLPMGPGGPYVGRVDGLLPHP